LERVKPRKVDRTEVFDISLGEDTVEVEYGLEVRDKKDLPNECPSYNLEIVKFLHKGRKYLYALHNGNKGPPHNAHPIEDQKLRASLAKGLPKHAIRVIKQNIDSFLN